MADIAGPNILSVARVNGSWIDVRYSAGAAGYTRIYAFVRPENGAWRQATSDTNLNGQIVITTIAGTPLDSKIKYEVQLQATVGSTLTAKSGVSTVDAWKVATPTLVSASRVNANRGSLTFENAVFGSGAATIYIDRRELPSGVFKQINSFQPSAASGTYGFDTPDGNKAYEVRIRSGQWSVLSNYSTARTVNEWWQKPAPATNLLAGRILNGVVTLTWAATATDQAPIAGQRIYRATGPTGQFTVVTTISGDKRTWQDISADPAVEYRYAVEPYNQAGSATSRPTVTAAATVLKPNAPTQAPTVTYVAVDSAKLTWTPNTSTNRPYTGQRVKMRNVGSTAFTTVANLGPGATEATVTVGPNRHVEFVIKPYNRAGEAESTSPVSTKLATTPAAPTKLTAKWGTGANILTSWPDFSTVGDGIDIEFATDGGTASATWFPGTTPSSPLSVTARSWQHTGVTITVPHWYRLRVRRTDIAGSPPSAWLYSGEVPAQTRPLPPTVLEPESFDATGVVRLSLIHNAVDGTGQSAGQIRFRRQGTSTWTTRSVGTATFTDIAANTFTNGDVLEVQAQTAAQSGVFSDWSPSVLFTLRARPTVTISSPSAGSWPSPTLPVEWVSSAQTEAVVELVAADGSLVDSRIVGPSERRTEFKVADQTVYTVQVTVRDAYQASLTASVTVTVALERPAPPEMWATFREDDEKEPASVLLQAAPVTALKTQRRNLAPALGMGQRTAPGVTATHVSLRQPDGTYLPALQVSYPDAGAGMEWLGLDFRDDEIMGGTAMLTSLSGPTVDAQVILRMNGEDVFLVPVVVPRWPDAAVVRTPPTSMPGQPSLEVRSTSGPVDVVVARVGIIGSKTGAGWDDYFDEDTRTAGLTYVKVPSGILVEAAPVSAGGDIPVVATVRIEYWRSVDDGATWQVVGDGGPDWSLVDDAPPLKERILYRARAYGIAGGWADSEPVAVETRSCDAFLHWGDRRVAHAGWDPVFSGTAGRQSVLVRYVGRDTASVVFGQRHPRVQEYRLTLMGDSSPLWHWIEAAEHPGTVTVRDPSGKVHRGVLTGFTWDDSTEEEQTVTFTVTESEALP